MKIYILNFPWKSDLACMDTNSWRTIIRGLHLLLDYLFYRGPYQPLLLLHFFFFNTHIVHLLA